MRIGICGFPQTGKSTVFQALSAGNGSASSGRGGVTYGAIKVPDPRVDALSDIFSPKKTVYAEITFMDVGGHGVVGGTALSSDVVQAMRNADVLVQVVRAYDSPMHADPPDPATEVQAFNDELVLLDLAIIEKRTDRFSREGRKDGFVDVNSRCQAWLEDGKPLRELGLDREQLVTLQGIQLLSLTPLLTVYNLAEDELDGSPWKAVAEKDPSAYALCGELEAELAELDDDEQAEMLEGLGLKEPASHEFIRTAYAALNLISFLTAGTDECRAWPIKQGTSARRAAGAVHSDIERGFIRAEVYRWEDLVKHGSEAALKGLGLFRLEGKDYVVHDGDVVNFRFNV
ncbi:MAG: redox-regulated ATPase YchF [Oligoflexia bacterium]|nr:redox-regulated ATPase YchF [Oligoflexia bacterium]